MLINKVYPLQLVTLYTELTLYVPDPALIQSTYKKIVAINPNTIFPYWAKIWASAHAMTLFLHEEPNWIDNKQVLEIGAGIGFPSFSIANKASSVIISDYNSDAVSLAQKNINHLNLTNVTATMLDWNHIPSSLFADTILLSDINYNPDDFNSLVDSINRFINMGNTIVLSTPNRITTNPFIDRLSSFVHKTKKYPIDNGETDIAVFILKK